MMNKSQSRWWILVGCLMIAVAATAYAAEDHPRIDYLGYAWETGGYPPTAFGDELIFTCAAVAVDALFEVDLADFELTFHMYGLTNCGVTVLPDETEIINYCGGYLDIYMDPEKDAEWGINPPNVTSPGTFTDGILFFHGSFNNFTIFMSEPGYGGYEGTLNGEGGWVINEVCANCAFTWGGAFTPNTAQVTEGYDLQIDGMLEMDRSVGTEETTWGTIKTLYR